MVFFVAANLASHSFQTCVNRLSSDQNSSSLHKQSTTFAPVLIRQSLCGLRLIDLHNGFFTLMGSIAVAVFTFTLWRSTEKLWRSAEDQRRSNDVQRQEDLSANRYSQELMSRSVAASSKAAQAAERQSLVAEKTLIASNRPHLIFETVFERKKMWDIRSDTPPFLPYRFHNYGSSPAIIEQSFAAIVIREGMDEHYLDGGVTAFHYYILAPNQDTGWTHVIYKDGPLTESEKDLITDHQRIIWAIGRTIYSGVLGSRHETRFCWQYDVSTGEFHEYGEDVYNRRT